MIDDNVFAHRPIGNKLKCFIYSSVCVCLVDVCHIHSVPCHFSTIYTETVEHSKHRFNLIAFYHRWLSTHMQKQLPASRFCVQNIIYHRAKCVCIVKLKGEIFAYTSIRHLSAYRCTRTYTYIC